MRVGILHPGSMGSALGSNANAEVYWAGDGRSEATALRASAAGMVDSGQLVELVRNVDVIISVCPPHAAVDVAREVSAFGFEGIYVDANAVAPRTTLEIAGMLSRFVDGGLVGPPPSPPRKSGSPKTRLYLSGADAAVIARLFTGSNVEAKVVGDDPGAASAVKMAFAGWTKGSAALLLSIATYARSHGVLDDLITEWEGSIPELPERLRTVSAGVGRKAWRFEGEMTEIAAALAGSGVPEGFHRAAAEIYARLAELKDDPGPETLDQVMDLIEGGGRS